MKDMLEQIYDELNAQVIRMLEHGRKQAERIAELERENSSLAYELNVALSGGSVSIPSADTDKLREAILALLPDAHWSLTSRQAFHWGLTAAADLIASTALQAPVREVPGYKLVPLEVTDAMLEAWKHELCIPVGSSPEAKARRAYRAMLAAAPVQEPKP